MINRALSIRQPWAWLIIHGGKDIENRTWATTYRGRLLIHAGKGMTKSEYAEALIVATEIGVVLPVPEKLDFGGIIGSVELLDCVQSSGSPWFFGPNGFVLVKPRPLPFRKSKGALGFFKVEDT